MFPSGITIPFKAADPLGLPRPLAPENVFGANKFVFANNLMPVPTGCLSHFHYEFFEPYQQRMAQLLASKDPAWSCAVSCDIPRRYLFLYDGKVSPIPKDLFLELHEPPLVPLEAMMKFFGLNLWVTQETQLLDFLTILREDIGEAKFDRITLSHPWAASYLLG